MSTLQGLCVLLSVGLFLPWGRAQEGSPPDAAALLDAFEAKAGGQARSGLKSLLLKGRLSMEGMSSPMTFVEAHVAPDKARIEVDMKGFGKSTQGMTGNHAWSEDQTMGLTVREGEHRLSAARFYAFLRGASWRTLYDRAELDGKESLNARPHHRIKLMPAKGKLDVAFLDEETGLLSRLDVTFPEPAGGELAMEWTFEEWKEVGKMRIPHRRIQRIATYKLTYELTSVEPDAVIAEKDIAPPAEAVRVMNDTSERRSGPPTPGVCSVEVVAEKAMASIRAKVKASEISKSLAVMLPEVGKVMTRQGASFAGPPFTRYHGFDGDEVDLEAGAPVTKPIEAEGRVKPGILPGGKTATVWHLGQYHTLPKSYEILDRWIAENSHESNGPAYEFYWTDPQLEPDPTRWRTQIFRPLK